MPKSPTPIDDIRAAFDGYLCVTRDWTSNQDPTRPRRSVPNPNGGFTYPADTIQVDLMIFASIFTQLWGALRSQFDHFYKAKQSAFQELAYVVTHAGDPSRLVGQCAFWQMGPDGTFVARCPTDRDSMEELCRTLRNGFSHFNFRFNNLAPVEYFKRLGRSCPPCVPDVSREHNYRIFILDVGWPKDEDPETRKKRKGKKPVFGALGTDSRLIGTHFGPLRFHLFRFLARLFSEPGRTSYTDIITGEEVS